MSQILITALENNANILKISHFINSFVHDNPHKEVCVLTYNKNQHILKMIPNIGKSFYIDNDFVKTCLDNPLFSDAFAINSFTESLKVCFETKWDEVINYSNDELSAYIVSALNAKKKTGTTISSFGSARTSNQWSNYLNFVNSSRTCHLISNHTVRHYMMNMPYYKEGSKIRINEEYSAVAAQNFAKIRKSKAETTNADIIAIGLEADSCGNMIDYHSLCEIIDTLDASGRFCPVLLHSGSEGEKQLVNDLNYKFNNNLVSINTDYSALASVLVNVDVLISQKNKQLAIADLLDTRVIEIQTNKEEGASFYTVNPGNYLIQQCEMENLCSDVNLILNQEFDTDLPVQSMNSKNKTYMQLEDDYGTFATQIRGNLNLDQELRYHIERMFHYQLMGYPTNDQLIKHIKDNTNKEDLEAFSIQVKDELTSTVKVLLAAVRSLKGVRQSKSNLQNFIGYLDTLITSAQSHSITSGALAIFEGDVENINSNSSEDNIKAIEDTLFGLKNNLQLLTNILTELVTDQEVAKKVQVRAQ